MGGRTTSFSTSSGDTGFRWPLSIPGGEVAGAELVRELPEAVALPTWQTLRCVLSWAGAAPGFRRELFDPEAMEAWEVELLEGEWEAELRLPLAVIVGVLVDAEGASPDRLARACVCVVDWALERGSVSTALAFAEAAALAWPEHPRYAYVCGQLLRTYGRLHAAERWMRRGIQSAAEFEDPEAHAMGLNSLGNVLYERGKYREAVRMHRRALGHVRRHRIGGREGEILHDLFITSWYAGDVSRAVQYACDAFEHYQPRHHRMASLAHDVAFSWVANGYFTHALEVLQRLPQRFEEPGECIRVYGSTARAAGGCGNQEVYDRAAREVQTILGSSPPVHGMAAALVDVAIGAVSLNRWRSAEEAVQMAVEIATLRGEDDVLARADDVLRSISTRRAWRTAPAEVGAKAAHQISVLASGFVETLEAEPAAVV